MSILLIRSLYGIRQHHQISSIVKLTTRSLGIRPFAQQKLKNDSAVAASSGGDRTDVSTDVRPLGERIKENTKTASYFGVIVFGIGVTGFIMFVVFRELFSSSSPNSVYSDALKECTNVNCSPFLQNSAHGMNDGFALFSGYTSARCIRQSNKRLWRRITTKATSACSPFNPSTKRKAMYSDAILHSRDTKQSNSSLRKRIGWCLFSIVHLLNYALNYYYLNIIERCNLYLIKRKNCFFLPRLGFKSVSIPVRTARSLSTRNNHFRRQSLGYRWNSLSTVIG